MNQALFPATGSFARWTSHEEATRLRRLRTLLGLFGLYAAALLVVVMISDGADIGCILGGIAGHVVYAAHRTISSWRDAAWLENAKHRTIARVRLQRKYA